MTHPAPVHDEPRSPAASVIVPSYRGATRLPALLDSLAAQAPDTPDFEVIVVVDGVDDGSVALVEQESRIHARVILFPENRGRVAALNAGFEAAHGEVLIRCDDDLRVPPGFVAAHVRAHRPSGRPVGVAGLTHDVHEDSPYARAYGRDAARRSIAHARAQASEDLWRHWAANCSITRSTWQQIGPYFPRYRAYGWEDVDYGYRLYAAGIPLISVPEVEAEHLGPARTAATRASKAFDAGRSRALFRSIHPEAPLASPSPGAGLWGYAVGAAARIMTAPERVARCGRVVDRFLGIVPRPIGRKLVALVVEAAGLAGVRTSVPDVEGQLDPGGSHPARPRVVIAHDYLTQRGGAERVVLSLSRAFPDAEIHTLFYEPSQTYPEFRDRTIRVSPLNRIAPLRRDPRLALPLLAPASSRMRIDADVVIASSSGWAHTFPCTGRKVVYCHSPARWLYLPEDYLGSAGRFSPQRIALALLGGPLRRWDRRAAAEADRYLANSSVVRARIKRVYGIDATTLFPPFSRNVTDGPLERIGELTGWGEDGGHYLVVSRLQPYKNIDRVIEAFRAMPDRRLLVVGTGPMRDQLRAMAPTNVRLVEGISDAQMRWAYSSARALIAASYEDFGLTPLEAGSHGIPTLALRAGGFLDTIREDVNGLFFAESTPKAISEKVFQLDTAHFKKEDILRHVANFDESGFIESLWTAAHVNRNENHMIGRWE